MEKYCHARSTRSTGNWNCSCIWLGACSKKYTTLHIEEFQKKFNRDCNYLGTSRPTAVNLFWAIDRMRESIQEITTIKEAQKY